MFSHGQSTQREVSYFDAVSGGGGHINIVYANAVFHYHLDARTGIKNFTSDFFDTDEHSYDFMLIDLFDQCIFR